VYVLPPSTIARILELGASGVSQRAIAAALRCSRTTVMVYLHGNSDAVRARHAAQTWDYLTTTCPCGRRKTRWAVQCRLCWMARPLRTAFATPLYPVREAVPLCPSGEGHLYHLDARGVAEPCVHCGRSRC
jgi:hypothetical protein